MSEQSLREAYRELLQMYYEAEKAVIEEFSHNPAKDLEKFRAEVNELSLIWLGELFEGGQ